jgi:cytochrome P450
MQTLVERDYFTDHEILKDPYAFFDALREYGPVYQPPGKDYYVVTGFEEALEVLRNHETFSAVISLQGAVRRCPSRPKATTSMARSRPIASNSLDGTRSSTWTTIATPSCVR